MRVNIFGDGSGLDHFLIDEVVNLIIINEHYRIVLFTRHSIVLIG
jgi:hypothetical protein